FAIENFLKLQLTDALDYGVPYDYGSAMHYNSHSFSKNGQPTMLPHNRMYEKTIGSKSEATFLDIMVLNLYYCEDVCLNRITCTNNGYQDPNSCERCKCLKGFTGRDCSEIERNSLCENQELFADGTRKLLYVDGEKDCVYHADGTRKLLYVDGEKDCVYHIKSKSGNRILIEVKTVSINPTYDYSCRADNKLEVKFQLNKTTSGAFLCEETTQKFLSENDHVMIRFTSTKRDNFADIYYQLQYYNKHFFVKKRLNGLCQKTIM
uniref:EGF-like domain-containing protein n=1 Tax=Strongyloides papillosus TaxID=174720 RepID=A0A0N5C106_STREA